MRFFRHVIAEYTCTKRCGYHRSVMTPTLSRFHLIAAITAAIPVWLVLVFKPWHLPWYYFLSILAGELLCVFVAGLVVGIVATPFIDFGTRKCRQCGAPTFCAGQHFDPEGSPRPHWSDIAIFIVFIALNVNLWLQIVRFGS